MSPTSTGGTAADLVVVGAGTMGAWTALLARRAGWSTTLVDAFGTGHPRATSGDETRIIRSSHGSDHFYATWAREALTAWRSFGDEVGESFFVQSGALWFGHREDGFEAKSAATLTALGIPVERLSPAEVAARWPQLGIGSITTATFEPEAGLLFARRGIAAVARAFSAEGGRFELSWAKPGRVDGRRLVDVETGDGRRIAAGQFVFAAGPWLPRLFPDLLGGLIRVTKQDVLFIGSPAGDGRFAAEWLPCWLDHDAAFYGVPAVDGRGMKLAPDRYGPVFDPTDGERIVDPESVRLVRRYLATRFPALADAPVVETRVCQYEMTPDEHWIIDRHPDFDNVWIAGGGSGHAFKHGPVIGKYLVERLAGMPPATDVARFGLGHQRVASVALRTGADGMVDAWADR